MFKFTFWKHFFKVNTIATKNILKVNANIVITNCCLKAAFIKNCYIKDFSKLFYELIKPSNVNPNDKFIIVSPSKFIYI